MKVSDYICNYLKNIGVKTVMGYTGGAIAHIIDSIYQIDDINFLHFNHEQGAALGASALAKYTNEIQVVMATSGPGATNLITGIAEAYFDSVPLLIITGQVNTYNLSEGKAVRQIGFQETDIVSMIKSITKYSCQIKKAEEVPEVLKKSIGIAKSGRPGPVLIDIPMDVQRAEIEDCSFDVSQATTIAEFDLNDIEEVLEMISFAEFPVILSGGGISQSHSHDQLLQFAESLNVPVLVSLMGKDSFPHDHTLFGGFIGAYGNRFGNILLVKSDLLIVLGSRLDSRQIGNVIEPFKDKKIIWVDIEANEIRESKLKVQKSIVSDVKVFLKEINSKITVKDYKPRQKLLNNLEFLKQTYKPILEMKRASRQDWHYEVLSKVFQRVRSDDVICVDVGQIQMISAQLLEIKTGMRFINSGGLAPMGYALPAVSAISFCTGKRCVAIIGDGGYQINIQELNLIVKNNLPVILILMNNKSLGMIKQFQDLYFKGRHAATDQSSGYNVCDFQAVTRAYGIDSFKISPNDSSIDDLISNVFNYNHPVLLEIDIDYDSYVYPKLDFDQSLINISPVLDDQEMNMINSLFEVEY
jgi:acetolactate synthase-1/2/3 large subunit